MARYSDRMRLSKRAAREVGKADERRIRSIPTCKICGHISGGLIDGKPVCWTCLDTRYPKGTKFDTLT